MQICPGHVWLHCLHGWNYCDGAENKSSQGPRGPVMSESLPSYSCVRTLKDNRPLRQLRVWQLRMRGWLVGGNPGFSHLVPAPGVSSTLFLWSGVWCVSFSAMSLRRKWKKRGQRASGQHPLWGTASSYTGQVPCTRRNPRKPNVLEFHEHFMKDDAFTLQINSLLSNQLCCSRTQPPKWPAGQVNDFFPKLFRKRKREKKNLWSGKTWDWLSSENFHP